MWGERKDVEGTLEIHNRQLAYREEKQTVMGSTNRRYLSAKKTLLTTNVLKKDKGQNTIKNMQCCSYR